MEKSRFWELLAKVKSGEATPEEQLELNSHLSASTDLFDLSTLKQIDECWELPMPAASTPSAGEVTAAWDRVRSKLPGQHAEVLGDDRRIKRLRYMSAAAVVLALAGICVWSVSKVAAPAPPQKNIVSTKNGSKSKVELPDGTQVWLNVGSKINYDENYGKGNREVTLTGEAYFDVAHDAKNPFVVHAGKMDIKVLGTVFNVKAYPGDATTEASLIKGSVEVTFSGRPQQRLILKPSDKISVNNKEANTSVDTARRMSMNSIEKPAIIVTTVQYEPAAKAIIETAWVNNKLIFRSKSFDELARDIERWFNVTVDVQDSFILDKKFTGTFSNESITDALYALSLSYPFHYKFDKRTNTVIIN